MGWSTLARDRHCGLLAALGVVLAAWLAPPAAAAARPGYADDLVVYWQFDDPTDLGRDSWNGHSGTIKGTSWSASGQVGGALHFDTLNDQVRTGPVNPIAGGSHGGATYAFWARPDEQSGPYASEVQVWKGYGWRDQQGDLWCSLLNTGAGLQVASVIYAPGWQPTFRWHLNVKGSPSSFHHVACAYDGDRFNVYFDGQLRGSADVRDGITDAGNSNPLALGEFPGNPGNGSKGWIDEVAVFGRGLNAAEIEDLYKRGKMGIGILGPVPEPATWAVMLAGLVFILSVTARGARRREEAHGG